MCVSDRDGNMIRGRWKIVGNRYPGMKMRSFEMVSFDLVNPCPFLLFCIIRFLFNRL